METYPDVRWMEIDGADRPSFSSDGTRIVYQNLRVGGLYIVGADGGDPWTLLEATDDLQPTRPDWSWSPETIAFGGQAGNGSTIWLIESDRTGLRQVPGQDGLANLTYPSWYQDPRWLVAVNYGDTAILWRLSRDGCEPPVQLTPGEGFCAGRPTAAPGDALAPVAMAGTQGPCNQASNQIWIVSPPSPDPAQLDAKQGRSPNWSPDGKWILFESNRDTGPGGNYQLFVAPVPGLEIVDMEPVALTDPSYFAQHAEWSRQQDRIVFERGNGAALGIIDVPAPFR
jgi:Tol biopolymer transport system component